MTSQTMRSILYSLDFRHWDLLQFYGFKSIDSDGNPIFFSRDAMSWFEFKLISFPKGFEPGLLDENVSISALALKRAASGGNDPAFLIYYCPGTLPNADLIDKYQRLETAFQGKLTTYSDWSWLVIPMSNAASDKIGNKVYEFFTMKEFYDWMSRLYKHPINNNLKLDIKHSDEFKKFIKSEAKYI